MSAVVIRKRVVVSVSVNGRPSFTSCQAVSAKLSCRFCTSRGNASSPTLRVLPPKSKPPFCSSCSLKSSVGMKPVCWNMLRKKPTIFASTAGWVLGSTIQVAISSCRAAAPLIVTFETSSSVTGMPVSRFFTFDVA